VGNCPNCGAELGFGIVFCPNCGGEIAGEVSDITETQVVDSASDTIGDSAAGHAGEGGAGRAEQVDGPDTATPPEEFATPQGEEWVAGDVQPRETTLELDAGVPGSEIPRSHGGGFQQQGEDGVAPQDMINPPEVDRPPHTIPQRPDDHLGLDDSGRTFQRRPLPWTGALAVLLMVVIVALGAWYIWGGDGNDDGNGNGEPNGNGDDPLKGLHLHEGGTSGNYPFEPPGEYHVTVAVRNNGSKSVDLVGYEVSITVWINYANKGQKVEPLTGTLWAGETRTFDVVVETEVFGGGDELLVGLTLRETEGTKHVHTINFEDTV
jgi:hypothetical protein